MSTIEPDDVPQVPGNPAGRWLAGVFTVGLLLAAALAIYLEPYFLLDRVRAAVRANDLARQRAIVDPDLIGDELSVYLGATLPAPGRSIEKRYETPSRFLVTARPAGPGDEPGADASADSTRRLTLVLERRGFSWWLAEVVGPPSWAIGEVFGPPPGDAPADSLLRR